MIAVVFNGETLGDIADAQRALSPLRVEGDGVDEVVQFASGAFVEAFDRGNRQASLSFSVVHQYATFAEAFEAVILRPQQMARLATLDIVIAINGVNKTLRMVNALRKPLSGAQLGATVTWDFSFTGGEWKAVPAAPGVLPDFAGGVFDSGDAFMWWYWGGTFGDGSGVNVDWSRELHAGTF